MRLFKIMVVLAGALAISACTQDVVIRNSQGVTVVGEVQGEYLVSRVEIQTDQTGFEKLGFYSTQQLKDPFALAWEDSDSTGFMQNQLDVRVTTGVTYVGTKGTATMVIDKRTVTCPVGFMIGTCLSTIEDNQAEIIETYKQKFTYLK